jgi:hypothetical protein
MSNVSFSVSKAEANVIHQIAQRAADACTDTEPSLADVLSWRMDITATHANGCRLDLSKLLTADDFTFAHDMDGIARHLDRDTGKLGDCFLPRCAAPASSEVE